MTTIYTSEYDRWKDSKLPEILTDFIDDLPYFEINRSYFDKWTRKIINKYKTEGKRYYERIKRSDRIPRMYDDGYKFNWDIEWENPTETTTLLLDPFTMEEVEQYEKTNEIYLPIELKYYLTHISRELRRYYGHLFKLLPDQRLKLNYKPEYQPFGILKECNSIVCDICDRYIDNQSYYYCRFCNMDWCMECKMKNESTPSECNHQHDFRYGSIRQPEPFQKSCDNTYCVSTQCIHQFPFYYYCWDCEEYYCPHCIHHNQTCPQEIEESYDLDTLFEVTNTEITYDQSTLRDTEETHIFIKYKNHNVWDSIRNDNQHGCIDVGEPGCGETDTIVLNGLYKGRILTFLVYESEHTFRYMESLFEYLCHEWPEAG